MWRTIASGALAALAALGAQAPPLAAQEPSLEELQDLERILDQPVQVASKRTQRLKEAPADVTVLRGQDLLELGYRTLGDALGGVLGYRTNQDRAYTGLGVRGLYVLGDQNTRVLILLDGHALNSPAEVGSSKVGEDFGIPMDLVERIEIVRGPASSLYGNNAFLGLVNVVTREPAAAGPAGLAEATAGSQGLGELAGAVGGGLGAGRWQVILSGMQRRGSRTSFPELAGDPALAGTVPGSLPPELDREERQSAYLRAAGTQWNLSAGVSSRTQGLASAPFNATVGSPGNRYRNRLSFGDARWTPALGPVEALVRLYGDRNAFSSTFDYDGIRQPGTQGRYAEADPDWSLGMELQARARLGSRLLLTLGQEQTWHHFSSLAGLPGAEAHTEVRYRVGNSYLQAEWSPAETVTVTAGLQEALLTVASAALTVTGQGAAAYPRTSQGSATPRLAVLWQPTAVDILKVLYGGGYRNPTLFEKYYSDITTNVANPDLEPERITTLQAMWVRTWASGLQSQVSASRSRWRHLTRSVTLPGDFQQFQNDPEDLVGTALAAMLSWLAIPIVIRGMGMFGGWLGARLDRAAARGA